MSFHEVMLVCIWKVVNVNLPINWKVSLPLAWVLFSAIFCFNLCFLSFNINHLFSLFLLKLRASAFFGIPISLHSYFLCVIDQMTIITHYGTKIKMTRKGTWDRHNSVWTVRAPMESGIYLIYQQYRHLGRAAWKKSRIVLILLLIFIHRITPVNGSC